MEAYPVWFRILSPILFIMESICGICLNLTVITSSTRKLRGSNFTVLLSRIDLVISLVVVPLILITVLLPPERSIVLCTVREAAMTSGTVATMAAIICVSLDRYYAIVLPPTTFLQSKAIRCLQVMVCLFAVLGFCMPFFSLMTTDPLNRDIGEILSCRQYLSKLSTFNLYEFYMLLFYIMASVSIIECYVGIINVAKARNQLTWKRRSADNSQGSKFQKHLAKSRTLRTVKISLLSICAVVLCWGPFVIISIVQLFSETSVLNNILQTTSCLVALSSVIWNPLLYSFLPKDSKRPNNFKQHQMPSQPDIQEESENNKETDEKNHKSSKPMSLLHPNWISPLPSSSTISTEMTSLSPNRPSTDMNVFSVEKASEKANFEENERAGTLIKENVIWEEMKSVDEEYSQ